MIAITTKFMNQAITKIAIIFIRTTALTARSSRSFVMIILIIMTIAYSIKTTRLNTIYERICFSIILFFSFYTQHSKERELSIADFELTFEVHDAQRTK